MRTEHRKTESELETSGHILQLDRHGRFAVANFAARQLPQAYDQLVLHNPSLLTCAREPAGKSGRTQLSNGFARIGWVAIFFAATMAATHSIQLKEEVDENFLDVETAVLDGRFTRGEEYVLVSESYTSTRPQFMKSNSMADSRSVEAWINDELFGDMDASQHHDEADSYRTLGKQVDEYIEMVDFMRSELPSIYIDEQEPAADFLSSPVDISEGLMYYEPQLWCFT